MTAPFQPFQAISGKKKKNVTGYQSAISKRAGQVGAERDQLQQMLMSSILNPTQSADTFLSYYQEAANAAAAPALRDFQNIIGNVQANTASRFGGNVSSEEGRMVTRTSDDFTRNLTEALARVGPQAVAAGQAQDQFTLGARRMLGSEELDLERMLLAAIQGQKDSGSPWGRILGTVAGVGASFIPGVGQYVGPAVIAGANS